MPRESPAARNKRFSMSPLGEPGRSRPGGTAGSGGGGKTRAGRPAPGRAARTPRGRRPSRSARTGRPAAARATPPACSRKGARRRFAREASRLRSGSGERPLERRGVVPGQLLEGRARRRGARVHGDLDGPVQEFRARPSEELAQAPLDAVADDGVPDSLRHGNADPRPRGGGIRPEKKDEMASGHADPGGVALFEFRSFAKAVVPGEGLPDGPARVHTESLLRPLRRRAERTARPERVRIRTRNPCVRLRRRLFG